MYDIGIKRRESRESDDQGLNNRSHISRPGDGYEGYYRDLETTMQIGTSEYFRKQVSAVVTAFMEVSRREREVDVQ